MTPRPALAATIAASLIVLGATGALAAGSPQLSDHAPDKTSPTTAPIVAPTTTLASTLPPVPTAPSTAPSTTSTTLALDNAPLIGDVVDGGDVKPSRFYDVYLAAGLADIQSWWATEFPRLYGEPFTPLKGGIFAAYPERTAPIPGCGFPGRHELSGSQRLRGVLLPRRRLHGVRRRRARSDLRTRRARSVRRWWPW